jgi:hypothetical protein
LLFTIYPSGLEDFLEELSKSGFDSGDAIARHQSHWRDMMEDGMDADSREIAVAEEINESIRGPRAAPLMSRGFW